ncbi:MAG: hypothetical protein ACT4P1_13770 [Sporichthyaceae bacterium]
MTKGAVAVTAVGVVVGWAGWGLPANAAAPDTLAVFSASAAATPYGVVTRVPAETSGGYLYSGTAINLGKARALAAGFTAGELGDLFIVSSAPPGTITSVPTVITAQEPPQDQSPREAELSGGRGGGVGGEARNFTLQARTSDAPSALADAAGQAVTSAFYSSGYSTSSSDTRVEPDGTVIARAVTNVQDILIDAPGAQLSIGSATSLATVTIAAGKKPVTVLQTRAYGAELGGVPVVFDENGISVADQVALPGSAMAGFDSALDMLAAQGLTFVPVPRSQTVTRDGAILSGAVFSFRYRAPDSIPRPSDIGADQTFTVASVAAAATSRARGAMGALPPSGTADAAPAAPSEGAGDTASTGQAPVAAFGPDPAIPGAIAQDLSTVGQAPVAGAPVPVGAAGAVLAAPDTALFLPARVADPLPGQVRDGYQLVLLVGAAAVAALFVMLRKRPT